MAKIKELRIKGQDGSFTESYEIGGSSDASDILLSNGTSVEDAIADVTDIANSNKALVEDVLVNKADTYHASEDETYGIGSTTLYGHVKITNDYDGGSDDPDHTALSENGAASLYNTLSTATESIQEAVLSKVEGEVLFLAPTVLEGFSNS